MLDLPDWTFELERAVIHGRVVTTSTASSGSGSTSPVKCGPTCARRTPSSRRSGARVVVPGELWPASTPVRPVSAAAALHRPDVRAGARPVGRLPRPRRGPHAQQHRVAARDQPGLRRGVPRRAQPRDEPELRWREYPADLRQTWFQRFFDTVDPPGSVDVRPIDAWDGDAPLGEEYGGAQLPGLVLSSGPTSSASSPTCASTPSRPSSTQTASGCPTRGHDRDADVRRHAGTRHQLLRVRHPHRGGGSRRRPGARMVLRAGGGAVGDAVRARPGGQEGRCARVVERPRAGRHLVEEDEEAPWFCSIHPSNSDLQGTTIDGLTWGDDAAVMAAITFRRPIQVFMHASAMLPEGVMAEDAPGDRSVPRGPRWVPTGPNEPPTDPEAGPIDAPRFDLRDVGPGIPLLLMPVRLETKYACWWRRRRAADPDDPRHRVGAERGAGVGT